MADIILEAEDQPEKTTAPVEAETEEPCEDSTNGVKTESEEAQAPTEKSELKEKSSGNRRGSRFHPYKEKHGGGATDKKATQRNRVFISNIPYDMKWQAIKDLMREKVGEVTYVELFKDAEGKSRVSDVDNSARGFKCPLQSLNY